ncbi:uncharacterized protein [Nothobranchius furzeri]|uniref:uncharacterized protein n=1 Tax=Nothobranchius furzeri TaxID=105023 RepID=UPI003904D89D
MMQFLGLANYCRQYIPNYAEKTQPLSEMIHGQKLEMKDKLTWTAATEAAFMSLKQDIHSSTTLMLPDYTKPFVQTVDCKNGFMTQVLLQLHGGKHRPIAFYSKKLDQVALALPACVQAIAAAALAVSCSADVVLFHSLTLLVPHAVDVLLLQGRLGLLSPARTLSYTALLISQPHITIQRCNTLNPATLLPTPQDGDPHNCVEATDSLQLPRPDLKDTPLPDGLVWFVDGSSSKTVTGVTQTGYSIVQLPDTIIEAKSLPSHFSAQAAEIIALTRACELASDRPLTVYTDSQYAFSTVHCFAKQWERRGMVTSTGKPITHSQLLIRLLKAVLLPSSLALFKCQAHDSGKDSFLWEQVG